MFRHRSAGSDDGAWSMCTLKQSARDERVVTDGLNSITSPLGRFALAFFSSLWWVSIRPSFWDGPDGFSFCERPARRLYADTAHLCGFVHPFRLSLLQSLQEHSGRSWWVFVVRKSLLLSDFRFLTFPILCTIFRHRSLSLL